MRDWHISHFYRDKHGVDGLCDNNCLLPWFITVGEKIKKNNKQIIIMGSLERVRS